jgi:hypothetical protein
VLALDHCLYPIVGLQVNFVTAAKNRPPFPIKNNLYFPWFQKNISNSYLKKKKQPISASLRKKLIVLICFWKGLKLMTVMSFLNNILKLIINGISWWFYSSSCSCLK